MTPNQLIDTINKALGVNTDSELAGILSEIAGKKVDKSQISRWRRSGFYGSTEALILLLLSQLPQNTKS